MSDYTIIQDEDVLKRMWQDTEDFGRKKEIRAHMYKIRENRLKDFYNTGEVTSSTTIKTTKSTSKGNEMTHADSLGDHSFMSLKSKEIRDSESPTRDAYKITGVTRRQDHGWDIVESNESSNDGKSQSTTRVATTAGKQQIQGGESNFAAKAEQKTSVYQDGDDKNFVKSVGASSRNVVKQEAHGGDDNSKFYSSSTTTSSSSNYSSEQKSSTGDVDIQAVPTRAIPTQAVPTIPGKTVVRTYTENIPNDLKNNANFIDGKTKVTTETKTLADGSTVTTTRYETIGSKSYTTSSSSKHQASSSQQEQRSSEAHHHDSRRSSTHDDVKITRTPRIEVCNDQSTVTITNNQNISKQFDDVEARRVQDSKTRSSDVTITRNEEVSRQHKTDDTQTRRVQDNRSSDVKIAEVTICKETKPIVDESTITRTVTKTTHTYGDSKPSTIEEKTTVTKTITDEQPKITKTTNYIEHPIETRYTTEKVTADKFINIEREKLVDEAPQQPRRQQPANEEQPTKKQPAKEQPSKEEPRYEQPERRQPIRPGKSEMDDTRSPLDGQYDTTYRTEFIPRRISVEVSPTHDAFVRSLRSVSPVNSRAGSIRNLRTPSQSSLRSSPEKFIRASPEKSPKKKSPERYDTITRRTEVDSSTLTRRKKPSRSPSPTTTASEIEFVRNTEDNKSSVFKNQKITRRHTEDNVTEKRPSSLDITTTTTTTRKKKITDRSPTSPLTDFSTRRPSPTKEAKRRDSIKEHKEDVKSRKVLRRTDTYEERCKEILGIANGQPSTPRKASLPDVARGKAPSKVHEFPSQIRKSPQKEPLGPYPEKKSPEKFGTKVQEFPSQVRRSPQKEPLEPYPQKTRRPSNSPNLNEFPSQIRKSPEKQPLEPYPQKCKPKSDGPKINEFPSQIRKSPEKEPLEPYPEKERTPKYTSKIDEFPSQTRRSPGKEPLEPYPEKERTPKYTSKIDEFPSQTRRSPGREPLEPYPEKEKFPKYTSKIDEFPSQTRKSPGKEPLEPYPEKTKPKSSGPKLNEFPSQIRKSPEKEPLEPYPGKERTPKYTCKIDEFPSQTRRSPGREPLAPYPEKEKTPRYTTKIDEFPSQTRRSPEKQPLEPYPEKTKPTSPGPNINEFPSQIRRSPEKEQLEPYPEKDRTPKYTTKIDEFPSQTRKSPERPQGRESPFEAAEFPSHRRKEKSPSPFRELRKSQDRVSLDDLPTMVTETRRSVDRVSLSDLETSRHETDFIRREKYDTDITLRKSKKTKTSKVKRVENGDESSSTSEDEEEITTTEVVDVTTGEIEKTTVQKKTEKGKTTTKTTVTKDIQGSRPKTEVRRSPVKKPREPEDGEDIRTTEVINITETSVPSKVTKSKKVQETYKTTATRVIPKPKDTTPKTEVVTVKKTFVTTAKKPIQEAPVVKKFIPTLCTKETRRTEKLLTLTPNEVTTHKIVKKDNPEKTLIKKPSGSSLKPNTGKISGVTEYTDQYSRVTKVTQKPKVTTKITVTPVISRHDEEVHTKTRVETTRTGKQVVNGDIKRATTQTPKKVSPATKPDTSRHVVSAIINIKPKQKPVQAPTTTRTVHKTTATKLITSCKKPVQSPKKLQNGHIPSDEEETDQEEIIEKTKKNAKLEKKCIATKSILIENAVADQREIIVDLKRSKSSREGTPDRLCPYPVRPDDDSSTPRYPDQIVEPEEPKQRSKTITNDIIHEDIEGITSTITEIKDESLLTVNEKVNKFLTTAEQITKKPKEFKPAPKVERPVLDVDDDLREDECLLSVSDKVSKFITTADELTKSKQVTRKPVQIEDVDVTVDENDESLLSVSEKVSHFIATAERVKETPKETPKAKPRSKEPSRSPSPRKDTPRKDTVDTPKKSPSPTREPINRDVCSRRFSDTRRDSLETTPKSSRRTSKDEPRMPLSPTERLRSTETIKKAKALFENISKEQEVLKQRDILSRPSVFEGRRQKEQEKEHTDVRHRSKSPGDEEVPHYMTPLDRTIKEQKPRERRTDDGTDTEDEDYQHSDLGDVPHYMLPLDRTLREKSPHKESVKQIEDIMNRSTSSAHNEEVDVRTTKFGVQLRRTDSGRATTVTQKQVTTKVETEDELNIEEIYDLVYLESLLETIVGYDIRRRIRAQIRIVKSMIAESKLEIVTSKSRSPVRETKETEVTRRGSSEYKSSYSSYAERRSSETKSTTTTRRDSSSTKEKSPERRQVSPERKQKSPEKTQITPEARQKTPERRQKSPERKPQSPERKTTKTECSKVFQTELKKTKPVTKKVFDDKPVWVTQKTLKKVTDTPVKKTVVTTTTKTSRTTSRSQKSPSKERAPTDVITSSYGVGPMDENGAPLFGLRALKAQNKSEKTKVQGTVIQSRYYSENGQEPVGEISVTKYSTDPKDLSVLDSKKDKGVSSVTTTQKFGYKGTPSLKSITSKTKGIESGSTSSTRTTKVTRRGSVKEMSQKFIENAVDSLKSERQSSYPKAGLILRTSSFKDTDVESPSSREGSPGYEETRRTVTTVKTSSSSGGKVDTFLTNKSRVTGVQDVITRMKNEETEGETAEDIEAKNLLNKFIGSQVILSGIESANKSSGGRKSVTKITSTTTTSESGKPTKTVTRTFTHPITPELLKTVWDEQTLNLLLEQSSSHDDRRHIKTRLREIMAEQEACADLVEKASEDITRQESKSSIHGESLLPLLQGLLDQPHDDQPADSGTESGEDLRSGLIIEVQSALDKLSASLRSSTTNISNDRRDSLLTLVSRLQAGLSSQITPSSSSERRSSLQGRFTKRKQRQSRHTVGVSTEELEDARKLMEEIAFNEPITIEGPELQKEDSTGSILSSSSSYKSPTKQVKNATAKPFVTSSNTSQSHSGTSSTVETPTETSESIDFPAPRSPDVAQTPKTLEQPPNFNHSTSVDAYKAKLNKHRPLSEAVSLDYSQGVDLIKIQKAVTQAATIKQLIQPNPEISESDDDPSTVKQLLKEPEVPQQQPKPDLIMQTNPIYSQPEESDDDVFVSNQYNEKANRFNTKKLKMKRANTIDIPKPLKYYEDDDESENEDLAFRRNSYLALRGPIRIGKLNVDKKVPEFQPKTDSDRKFVAFLNKHTDDKSAKVAPWSNQATKKQSTFGSIRSTFEKFQSPATNLNATNLNSAKNFWKSADDAITAGRVTHSGPKISKQSARNLQQMFEEKQKQTQYNNTNVVTGSLKVDTKSLEGKRNVKIVTQPNQINQFSHAPMSAFKPVRKFEPIQPQPISNVSKVPLKTTDPNSPMYLYSPKPFNETPSPTNHAPWLARSGESRVLSIAASKFEGQQKERPGFGQRRPSKEKILIPPGLQHQEKLASPGIVRNLNQHTSVRKLSGQFESFKGEREPVEYDPTRVFIPGENYTIQYDDKPKPQVYNAEYTITQRINLPPVVEDIKQNDQYVMEHNQKQLLAQPMHVKEPLQRQKSIGGYQQEQPKVFQQATAFEADQQFTSNYQFKPKSPTQPNPTKPKHGDDYISYDRNQGKTSQENLQEYTAVSSKVMRGPVTQQAVTVQNAPKSRDQHDFERAFSLKATLEKFNQLEHNHTRPLATQSFKVKSNNIPQHKSLPEQNDVPKMVVYNNVSTRPVFCVNDKPLESLEINERGESVLTGKFSLPALSKSESWHQICQGKENLTNKPSPRASPNSRSVTRSKSSHTLAIPKQYEAGMSKAEMLEKQKSLEAYFGGKKTTADVKKTTINRVKTSQKISTQRQTSSSGLSRSKTLPDIVCLDRLDDSNIDEVFEEIFKSKQTSYEGPYTSSSQVTTRVTTQQKVTPKPMSPFAKFKQLDKQNSLNSPPSTPKTPTGSGTLFKFTDPALNQSANTIKQRLLQWCQMRTHGYENIQLDNFSTSWADGMAFCALIHRFVPDAFDYNALNPKNRRHNFTLAFKVAEDKAGIFPLLDVDDMVALSKPDWKCVFTYVQSIYRKFKDAD